MKVKEVAKAFNLSEGRIRGVLKTWKIGEEVKEFNLNGLKEYLVQKFGKEECAKRLGFEIVYTGTSNFNNKQITKLNVFFIF